MSPEAEEGTLNFRVKLPLESDVIALIRIISPSESFTSIPTGFPARLLSTVQRNVFVNLCMLQSLYT